MAEIIHRVQMKATPEQVYTALTEEEWLTGWWTREAKAEAKVDSLAEFRACDGRLVAKMRVAELEHEEKSARVSWHCVDGPPDWIGTNITFDLAKHGDGTIVRFQHADWREVTDFMGHSSAHWAYLLLSLKSFLETPEPEDLYI